MELSDKKGIQQIVLSFAALGLKEIVICPGSRNAPLVTSFNRHPGFHCTSIRDERAAGFFALGKALALKEPVALLCTSGSAPLNFGPSIAEAYYQKIPLIVLTADRPKTWTDQGDGQTINQTHVFRNYTRFGYELNGDAASPADLWFIRRCVSEGFNNTRFLNPGPVHFNVPMSEPLYRTEHIEDVAPRVFTKESVENRLGETTLKKLASVFSSCQKVMILTGQHPTDKGFLNAVIQMSRFDNLIVLTESTSNIHHPEFIEQIDRCITGLDEVSVQELQPDLLITVGGAIVSKRIKSLLRNHHPSFHWHIDPFDSTMDTYQSLTNAISMDPAAFFNQLHPYINIVSSDYKKKWLQLKEKKEIRHDHFIGHSKYSDLKVFHEIYQHLPDTTVLHVANSSPIRYAQLFAQTNETYCNRGASGIDGCTATAMGAAAALPHKNHLLITGDVAFHYDVNGLWNDEYIQNLKIIIINNGGGGIFRIIEGPDEAEERALFYVTAMKTNAEKIAAHYNWNYLAVKEEQQLTNRLSEFFHSERKRAILEIFTDADTNPAVLKAYWASLNES